MLNSKFPLVFDKYNAVAIEVPTPKGVKKVPKAERWALAQIRGPLLRHIHWFVKHEFLTEAARTNAWFGAFYHFTADAYDGLIVKGSPIAQAQLSGFLDEFWRVVIPKLQDEYNTCANEGMNKLLADFCRKDRPHPRSFHGRAACAVLVKCKGRDWPIEAWRRFGFEDMSQSSIERLTKRAQKYRRSAKIRNTIGAEEEERPAAAETGAAIGGDDAR